MRKLLLLASAGLAALAFAPSTHAGQLGTSTPANCVEHTPFDGGADAPGDYRCAGLAIEFHVNGYVRSPFPLWAGQWLFVDPDGSYRVGSCTFNRGVHPNVFGPSAPVTQAFPNDPTGEKRAYLTWRYGDTTDNATAAAIWAVAHYYAQDAAGTNRNSNGSAPLITDLGQLAEMTGNQGLEDLALALDAEAGRHRGPYGLGLTAGADGSVRVSVDARGQPVSGVPVAVHVSGDDNEYRMTTLADGSAQTVIALPSGAVTVSAVAAVPGPAAVYRGSPAAPDPHGAQTLLTGGDPSLVTALTTVDVPFPTTTTVSETTTTLPETTTTVPETTTTLPETTTTLPETTTTLPETTTTLPETTTTVPETTTTTIAATTIAATTTTITIPETTTTIPETTTTLPETTTTSPETTTTVLEPAPTTTNPVTVEAIPTTAPPPPIPAETVLPRTGGSGKRIAYLATSLLVGGIGLAGGSRRPRPA